MVQIRAMLWKVKRKGLRILDFFSVPAGIASVVVVMQQHLTNLHWEMFFGLVFRPTSINKSKSPEQLLPATNQTCHMSASCWHSNKQIGNNNKKKKLVAYFDRLNVKQPEAAACYGLLLYVYNFCQFLRSLLTLYDGLGTEWRNINYSATLKWFSLSF